MSAPDSAAGSESGLPSASGSPSGSRASAAPTGSSSAYITPNELTTSSLAPIPETIPTPIFQSKPRGSRTGSMDFPI